MRTVTSKDGTTIAYEQSGTGPVVILVGGAFNSRSFGPNEPLVALLAERLTVINYDRRGRGDSGDTAPYAIEREIEDIDALIDAAGGSVFLYGISSGAALALAAANKLSDKIKKLALYEAPFVVDDTRPPLPQNYVEQMKAHIGADRRGAAVQLFMTKGVGVPAIFVAMMRLMPVWSKLKAVAHTVIYDTLIVEDKQRNKPLPAHQWSSVTLPTLVVDGGKSPLWMRHAMQALAAALPNAQYRTLEGQTHIVKPEALAPVLQQFFAQGA